MNPAVAATDASVVVRLHDLTYDACDPVELDCPCVFRDAALAQGALLIQPLVLRHWARVLEGPKEPACDDEVFRHGRLVKENRRGIEQPRCQQAVADNCPCWPPGAAFLDFRITPGRGGG